MRCAVIGSPIAHSLSPAMHRAAYAQLGLDWTYEAVLVEEDGLQQFLSSLGDDVRGLSVTAPLKRQLAELIALDPDEPQLGVANTVVIDDDGARTYNTDVPGALAALQEGGIGEVSTVRILGGGATAASVAYVLAMLGAKHLELVVRDPSRANEVIDVATSAGVEVGVHSLEDALIDKVDLLVSTVPNGVASQRVYELVEASRGVFDVAYDPWPSSLITAAEEAELPCVTGIDLLAHQAVIQVELMTGESVSPQVLRDAALLELAAR